MSSSNFILSQSQWGSFYLYMINHSIPLDFFCNSSVRLQFSTLNFYVDKAASCSQPVSPGQKRDIILKPKTTYFSSIAEPCQMFFIMYMAIRSPSFVTMIIIKRQKKDTGKSLVCAQLLYSLFWFVLIC